MRPMTSTLQFVIVLVLFSGLAARIIDKTNSMADVFTAFYNFSLLIESKV